MKRRIDIISNGAHRLGLLLFQQWIRIGVLLIFFAASSLTCSGFACADTTISENEQVYDVVGMSLRDVNVHMFSGTPILVNGKKHIAVCQHRITWRFTFDSDDDWCIIKNVVVNAKITITMPRWVDYSKASSDMQEKWDTFYARLAEHENGHAEQAKNAARDIERAIGVMKKRSCQELREAANQTGNDILRQLKAIYEEYDARTKHGVLQDAVLHEF